MRRGTRAPRKLALGAGGTQPLTLSRTRTSSLSRIFGFRHSARLVILTRPDAAKLSAPESEFALLGVRRAFSRSVFQNLADLSANGLYRCARDIDGGADRVQHRGDTRDAGGAFTSTNGRRDLRARSRDVVDLARDGSGPDRGHRDRPERFGGGGGIGHDESFGRDRSARSDGDQSDSISGRAAFPRDDDHAPGAHD